MPPRPVPPPGPHQSLTPNRLKPKTTPVYPRLHPSRRLFRFDRLRVRLQRHLLGVRWLACPEPRRATAFLTPTILPFPIPIERLPNRIQNPPTMPRTHQPPRPPSCLHRPPTT